MEPLQASPPYDERLSRLRSYIYDHLDDPLDLDRLSEIACLSPYHCHRLYHATQGETIAATVKRLRLQRATGYLLHTAMPITEIGKRTGYPNLQSFTRIFKSAYGMPPAAYRKLGGHTQFLSSPRVLAPTRFEVELRTIPPLAAVMTAHRGSYMKIGQAFDRLYAQLGLDVQSRAAVRTVAVYYDDPDATPERQLRSMACVVFSESQLLRVPTLVIRGGTYAALRHVGPYAEMRAAYRWLYGEWLLHSGYEAADAPIFEEYLNDPQTTAPAELITDIYLPLADD